MLDKWLAEKDQTLLAAILEVDVEVVLLDTLAMRAKLVLDLLHEFALSRYLRRLNQHV